MPAPLFEGNETIGGAPGKGVPPGPITNKEMIDFNSIVMTFFGECVGCEQEFESTLFNDVLDVPVAGN